MLFTARRDLDHGVPVRVNLEVELIELQCQEALWGRVTMSTILE